MEHLGSLTELSLYFLAAINPATPNTMSRYPINREYHRENIVLHLLSAVYQHFNIPKLCL